MDHLNPTPSAPVRTVIIGGAGFVGAASAKALARDGKVVAITRGEIDLTQPGAGALLAERLQPGDSVVFVSAIAPCKNAEQLTRNVAMVGAALEAFAKVTPAHLTYISSDAVYADDANPVSEISPAAPGSSHGVMHLAREILLKSLPIPLAILRPSLLYGAADPHNGYGPNRFRRQAAKVETIKLFGEGEEMRDHVLIDDLAELVRLVVQHRSKGILNVASGVSTSFRGVAEAVVKLAGTDAKIEGSPRQSPITHRHFDITAALRAFPSFHPTPLAEGLKKAAA